MRLVLDTNVLISAFFWSGNERDVLIACWQKTHQSIISPQILRELDDVLTKKFDVPREKILEYVRDILLMSEVVFPSGSVDVVVEDPDDNVIIETALMGQVDAIITGDQHLLKYNQYQGIQIMSAKMLK